MSWVPDFSGGGTSSDFSGDNIDAGGGWSPASSGGGGSSSDPGFMGPPDSAAGGGAPSDGGPPLSPLQQAYAHEQSVPEVTADSSTGIDYGDWNPAGIGNGTHQAAAQGQATPALDHLAAAAHQQQQAAASSPYNSTPSAGHQDIGFLQKVMMGLGLKGKDGTMDLSDPKQLQAWMRLLTAGGGVLQALFQHKATGYKSPTDLMASMPGGGAPGMGWSPGQQAGVDSYFNHAPTPWNQRSFQYASSAPGTVVPGHTYAHGGGVRVHGDPRPPEDPLHHLGALSAVAGGQDDNIDASLSPGEYVMDADTVSAAGDGNNEAGAARLDQFRENLRKHKRSAPPDRIPPKARPLLSYMPKGGN